MELFEKSKKFIKKHQKEIIFIGGSIVGIIVTAAIYNSKEKEVITKTIIPEWAEKWREKCDKECLLYENGLPIFADDNQMTVYRDACMPEAIPDLIEWGFKIIDRD